MSPNVSQTLIAFLQVDVFLGVDRYIVMGYNALDLRLLFNLAVVFTSTHYITLLSNIFSLENTKVILTRYSLEQKIIFHVIVTVYNEKRQQIDKGRHSHRPTFVYFQSMNPTNEDRRLCGAATDWCCVVWRVQVG